ncbi:MAG TPA: hypothetical protein VLC48_04645 [Gemmatimonadota bacterium]|nr:hypothetical protein [Gemmatimonadota bacterium]
MMHNDLQETERGTFRAAADLGIWDIMIAAFLSMFAFAPLLSGRLGDFWSSAIFVPILGAVWLVLWFIKQRFIAPRIGVVRFGSYRQARLQRLTLVLLAINIVAFALGTFFALRFQPGAGGGLLPVITLSAIFLVGFSLAAYLLDIPRYFAYGLLLGVAAFVGEWLFRGGHASHHGYPVVFGFLAALIATVGLATLLVRVRSLGPRVDGPLAGEDR